MRNKDKWELTWFTAAMLSLPVLMFAGAIAAG